MIVTEGAKTEPGYLADLCHDYRLSSANIEVTGDSGSDPLSVVDHAILLYEHDADFDRVFCVFDRDTHQTFTQAVQKLKQPPSGLQGTIHGIISRPCFEYWILLHYEKTASPYSTAGGSPCSKCIKDLKNYLPNYGKGMQRLYEHTKPNIEKAKKRSAQISGDPSTKMHVLVQYLQDLRS